MCHKSKNPGVKLFLYKFRVHLIAFNKITFQHENGRHDIILRDAFKPKLIMKFGSARTVGVFTKDLLRSFGSI